MRVLGIDLAWAANTRTAPVNETGLVAVEADGTVCAARWTRGVDETVEWINNNTGDDAFAMVDAPLVVTNETGQRSCEKQTGAIQALWPASFGSTRNQLPWLNELVCGGRVG